jgi:poly(3-hydroxybutyrate) depolymerase
VGKIAAFVGPLTQLPAKFWTKKLDAACGRKRLIASGRMEGESLVQCRATAGALIEAAGEGGVRPERNLKINSPAAGGRANCLMRLPGKRRWLALWLLACGVAKTGGAEPMDGQPIPQGEVVQRDYVFSAADPKRIPYSLYVPTGYVASKPAPLIVLLHGWASNPWQIIHYMGIVQEAEKRGYIVVAPTGYNDVGGYGNRGPGKNGWLFQGTSAAPADLGERSEKDVMNVLGIVRANYAIDSKRIYLLGHSMGGGGVLHLAMKYKGEWAALAALAPAIYSNPEALVAIRTTPIIMVQGDLDVLVKVENTRRWVEEMKQLKMDYAYIEIKGGDHIFSMVTNPAMIAKIFDFFDQHPKSSV